MDNPKIKSALEIAMEKTANIPKLTPEELREQKEREYAPLGRAIANKYLEKTLRQRDVETQLSKHQGQEKEIVRRAFLLTLCQSIELEDMERSRRVIEGIQILKRDEYLEEISREIEKISREFHQERQQRHDVLEKLENGKLEHLGIRGSAIKTNLENREDWQQELDRIQLTYKLRIDKLKEKVSHYVGA